jgi:hypothetical protein
MWGAHVTWLVREHQSSKPPNFFTIRHEAEHVNEKKDRLRSLTNARNWLFGLIGY